MASLKLLIVDDDPLVSDLISRKLSRLEPGFDITVLPSGSECMDHLSRRQFDCILSDYQMPDMDGMELLDRIRQTGDLTPFIFVTGQGSEELAREAFKHGAYDYFTKEVGFAHFERIRNSIRHAVNTRRAEDRRHSAERHLAEQKNTLDAIIAGIADGIAIIGADYRTTFQNGAYKGLIGGALGEHCYSVIQGRDSVCDGCPVALTFEDGLVHTVERPIAIGDRRLILDVTSSPLRDARGNITAVVKVVRDITEKNRARREILRLSRQNMLMLESLGEGIYGLDLEGKTTFINKAALEMTGWSAEELAGRSQHNVLHHSRPDGSPYPVEECPIYDAFRSGSVHHVADEVFWRKDGTSFPVEYTSTPVVEDGKVTGAVVVFRDVTERKIIEDALRTSESRYREAEEIAGIGSWEWLVEQDRVIRSDGLLKIFGVERAGFGDSVGSYMDMLHPDDRGRVEGLLKCSMASGKDHRYDYEARILCPDGTEKTIQVFGRFVFRKDGRPLRVLGTVQDVTARKKSEVALADSESRYRTLMDNAGDAILTADAGTGIVIDCNRRACGLFGMEPEELVGMHQSALHPPEDAERCAQVFSDHARDGGSRMAMDLRIQRKDGSTVPVEISANIIELGGRKVVHGIFRDITERKNIEDALRRAEGFYKEAEAITKIGNWQALTDGGHKVVWSDGMFTIFGITREQFGGNYKSYLDFVHPDDLERVMREVERFIVSGGTMDYQTRIVCPDGTVKTIQAYGTAPLGPDGKAAEIFGTVQDITEQKNSELALRRAEGFYKEAEAITKIGNWQWLAEKDKVVWSDGMLTIFGITREQFGGTYKSYLDLVHPDDIERVMQEVERSITAGKPMDYQTRIICPDGTEKVIQAYGTVSFDADGRPVEIFGTVQDITERKALEKQREELFAMLRHDMKTPLTVISSNAEMVLFESRAELSPDSLKMLQSITTGAAALSRMIDDIEAISRLETGSYDVRKEDTDMADLLLEVSVFASERARAAGLAFNKELPPGPLVASVNGSYIRRAVTNLVDNAVKYTPRGGSVSLSARLSGDGGGGSLEISVSDTGPGIPEHERGLVFNKHYRSPGAAPVKGAGLGLAIVKAVAAAHGGHVEITSPAEEGCTFTLRLPMA